MPYVKDNIGTVPYYVPKQETRRLGLKSCDDVYNKFKKIGIEVKRENTDYGCFLTYLDIYSTNKK